MGRETNKNLIKNNKENKTIFLDFLKNFRKKLNKTELIKKTESNNMETNETSSKSKVQKFSIWSFFILYTPTLKLDIVPNVRKH